VNVFDELSWRGLVHQVSDADKVREYFATPGRVAYCGFDPSAPSLHVGNMVPLISLLRLKRAGHKPIFLAGGGTGLIGDPSGKEVERTLQDKSRIDASLEKIKGQVAKVFGGEVWVENNADWLLKLTAIELLRDVGKHFTVNWMMAKDAVKSRLAREDVGISYTEFSYMILQSYDYYHLFEKYGCMLQFGGSDQWGNITAGAELIRRKTGKEAYALTFPLITTADGKKFGKSEKGAIYMDPEMTPPTDFHNFWMLTDDRDVIRFMKFFTFLTGEEIEDYEKEVAARPEKREAQKRLAAEMTRMVHGPEVLADIERAHAARFGGDAVDADALYAAVRDSAPSVTYADEAALPDVPQMLVDLDFAPSKGKAKEFLKQGAVRINNQVFAEQVFTPGPDDLFDGSAFLLAMGKKKLGLVRLGVA